MNKFSVGEVALYVGLPTAPLSERYPGYFKDREGSECKIVSGLMPGSDCILKHKVVFSDGSMALVRPESLRKKRPPLADEDLTQTLKSGDWSRWCEKVKDKVVAW